MILIGVLVVVIFVVGFFVVVFVVGFLVVVFFVVGFFVVVVVITTFFVVIGFLVVFTVTGTVNPSSVTNRPRDLLPGKATKMRTITAHVIRPTRNDWLSIVSVLKRYGENVFT